MKKSLQKAFAITLSATLAVTMLAGCGGSGSTSSSSGSSSGTEASADAGKTDLKVIYTAEPTSLLPGSEALIPAEDL